MLAKYIGINSVLDKQGSLIAMNRNEAKRLGIDYLVDGRPGRSSTASGVVDSYVVQLAKVKVGSIELRDVTAAVVDSETNRVRISGKDLLRFSREKTERLKAETGHAGPALQWDD